jgi:hypothetical protein
MLLSLLQNIGNNPDIKMANRSFQNMSQFKYLGTTVINQDLIQEEFKKDLILVMLATIRCRTLVFLSAVKKVKIRIYKTINLLVVLYECETVSVALREEYRLRVFENKALRGIFGQKRDEVTGNWEKLHNKELRYSYSSSTIIRII